MGGADEGAERRRRLTATLVAVAQHDRRAFTVLYRETAAKLFGICLRICGDRKAAEDVVQEVYLSVWLRAGGFDPARGSAMAWLATMARNRAIDWRRARGLTVPGSADDAPEPVDDRPSAVDLLLVDEVERRLHYCLDQLTDQARTAIRAAFFEGLTYAELAARADVPLGTMKSWVRRGLLRLRDCLEDADDA